MTTEESLEKIIGIEGMDAEQVNAELANGGKFVTFSYCVSWLISTYRGSSGIYFLRAGERGIAKGMPFTLISLFFGWWGIPFGLAYTPICIIGNLEGGKDVTNEIIAAMRWRGWREWRD